MNGNVKHMTNAEIAKKLDWLAGELRAKGESAEPPFLPPMWTCPLCLDEYSWVDGKRRFMGKTPGNALCLCPDMPGEIAVHQPNRKHRTPSMEALDLKEVRERLNVARVEVAKMNIHPERECPYGQSLKE